MSAVQHLILACATLALLSGLVLLRLLSVRVAEMKTRGLDLQDVNTSLAVASRLGRVQAADNFKNLFEMPVLFYAWCALVVASGQAQPIDAAGAWVYVALRWLHSLIQCSYNRVLDRFIVYIVSSLWLLACWGLLAWRVFHAAA